MLDRDLLSHFSFTGGSWRCRHAIRVAETNGTPMTLLPGREVSPGRFSVHGEDLAAELHRIALSMSDEDEPASRH